jgi:hypothetical protein
MKRPDSFAEGHGQRAGWRGHQKQFSLTIPRRGRGGERLGNWSGRSHAAAGAPTATTTLAGRCPRHAGFGTHRQRALSPHHPKRKHDEEKSLHAVGETAAVA